MTMYLAVQLFEIGPTVQGDTVTHSEIRDYQKNTGIKFDSWQALTIRQLSADYLRETLESKVRGHPSPMQTAESNASEAETAEGSFRSAMAGRFNKRKK